jgi:hypothetical protein
MRGDKGKQLFTYSIIVLMKEYTITSFFIPLMNYFDGGNLLHFPLNIGMWISEFYWYPLGMLLPIPLLALYNGENGKKSNFIKYGFYAFYPAHLILLYIIKILV